MGQNRLFPILILASTLALAGLATGQVNPGTPTFSAYDTHTVDTINLQNLNIILNVPVMSKSGAIPFSFRFGENSYMFVNSVNAWQAVCPDGVTPTTKYSGWEAIMADGTVHALPPNDFYDVIVGKGGSCLNASVTDAVTDQSGFAVGEVSASEALGGVGKVGGGPSMMNTCRFPRTWPDLQWRIFQIGSLDL